MVVEDLSLSSSAANSWHCAKTNKIERRKSFEELWNISGRSEMLVITGSDKEKFKKVDENSHI